MAHGSFQNQQMSHANRDLAPSVGMGVTVLFWTDRHAYTVIKVRAKTMLIQWDKATRVEFMGMGDVQRYSYEPDPKGVICGGDSITV